MSLHPRRTGIRFSWTQITHPKVGGETKTCGASFVVRHNSTELLTHSRRLLSCDAGECTRVTMLKHSQLSTYTQLQLLAYGLGEAK